MKSLVDEAEKILTDKNIPLDDFGKLLDYTWHLKKGISTAISTNSIDEQYSKAIRAGAIGGKLLGAGGGGFLLFYVPLDKQAAVRDALSGLLYVPFRFEDEGTKVIFYQSEQYDKDS